MKTFKVSVLYLYPPGGNPRSHTKYVEASTSLMAISKVLAGMGPGTDIGTIDVRLSPMLRYKLVRQNHDGSTTTLTVMADTPGELRDKIMANIADVTELASIKITRQED